MNHAGYASVAKHGAYVLTSGIALYLLAPAFLMITHSGQGPSGTAYWTELYSIAAVLMFTAVLGVRSILAVYGKWLDVFSVGAAAVLGYLGGAFIISLPHDDLGAALYGVVLFGISGGAGVALIVGWIHGVVTRRMHRSTQIDEGSLARTRYGL